ncbi:hypothetical protein [Streptomyces albiaxialis]
MRRTRIVAAAAGVVLMAGLTACGSDGGGDDDKGGKGGGDKAGGSPAQSALAALKAASTTTEQQKSARVDGDQKQTVQGQAMNSTNKGSFDWSEGGMTGKAEITMQGGAAMGAGNKPMQARYLPDAMYIQMAAGAAQGKWIEYDYDVLAKKAGPSGAYMKDQIQNNNPARSVQLLMATGKVKAVGSESVRGVKATHYTGDVKLSELTRMQSKDLSESDLQALEQQFQQQGLTKERIDLWIDDKDLLVKKRETAKNKQGTTSVDNTVYYTDYGTDVNVTEPSGAVSFEKMMSGGAGAGAS